MIVEGGGQERRVRLRGVGGGAIVRAQGNSERGRQRVRLSMKGKVQGTG